MPNSTTTAEAHIAKWRSVEVEPDDKQSCHIRGSGAMMLIGIPYLKDMNGWCDILATPEAGALYNKSNGITAWIPESELDLDSGYPENEEINDAL